MATACEALYAEVNGQRLAITCEKVDVTRKWNRQPRKTINRQRRAPFYSKGVPEFTLKFSTVILKGTDVEVDWVTLERTETVFTVVIEEEGGKRRNYLGCLVDEIGDSSDPDGKVARDITVMALDERSDS